MTIYIIQLFSQCQIHLRNTNCMKAYIKYLSYFSLYMFGFLHQPVSLAWWTHAKTTGLAYIWDIHTSASASKDLRANIVKKVSCILRKTYSPLHNIISGLTFIQQLLRFFLACYDLAHALYLTNVKQNSRNPPLFSVFEDTLKCRYQNGGCEQFCDGSGRWLTCKCAPGYTLGDDKKSCIAQGGKISDCKTELNRINKKREQTCSWKHCVSLINLLVKLCVNVNKAREGLFFFCSFCSPGLQKFKTLMLITHTVVQSAKPATACFHLVTPTQLHTFSSVLTGL